MFPAVFDFKLRTCENAFYLIRILGACAWE